MTGTRSLSAMSACLPIRCSIIQQASSDPTASPSGLARAVTNRRSALAMELSTASIIASGCGLNCGSDRMMKRRVLLLLLGSSGRQGLGEGLLRIRFVRFSGTAKQLIDSQLEVLGLIDLKRELRNVPHSHPLQQFVADEAAGCGQRLSSLLFLYFTAIDGNVYPCRLAARVDNYFADISEADSRVAKFARNHGADLFAQRLGYAVPMVLSCPWFYHENSP